MVLSDYVCKLDKDAIQHCEEVLHETDEKRVEFVQDIRGWLIENSYLNAYTGK